MEFQNQRNSVNFWLQRKSWCVWAHAIDSCGYTKDHNAHAFIQDHPGRATRNLKRNNFIINNYFCRFCFFILGLLCCCCWCWCCCRRGCSWFCCCIIFRLIFFSVRCLADYESESVFVHISTESKSEIERYRAASKRLHDPLCWHGISVNLYAQKQIGNKPKQIVSSHRMCLVVVISSDSA